MSLNDSAYIGYTAGGGSEIDQDVYVLGLLVPPGRRFFFIDRILTLTQNSYVVEVMRTSNGFTGGTEGLHAVMNEGRTSSVQSRLYGDVTPQGDETVVRRSIVEAGDSPGRASVPPPVTDDSAQQSIITPRMYRIIRADGGGPYRLSLEIYGYEYVEDT